MRTSDILRLQVEGALAGWTGQLAEPMPADAAALLFEVVGDATRLGVRVPKDISAWLADRPRGELEAAIAALRPQLAELDLPATLEDPDAMDTLAVSVRRRDGFESAVAGLTRTALVRGYAPVQLSGWEGLMGALGVYDARLAEVADAESVWQALDERTLLLEGEGWLDRAFRARASAESDRPEATESLGVTLPDDPEAPLPPAEFLHDFCTQGLHHGFIMRRSERDSELREAVAETIDALLDAGEEVAFVAMRWRQSQKGASTGGAMVWQGAPIPVISLGLVRAAAQTEEMSTIRRPLGALAPLDAEAQVVHDGRGWRLEIFEGTDPIADVLVAGRAVARPASVAEPWSVEIPVHKEPFKVVVRSSNGRAFEDTMAFDLGEADSSR